ncbi:hypothetical protein Tcan_11084 [Toxocara canis]|uniref:Uncharacterized protein n=1 Tax=Toxocara canis TaxID=6265 RepID=A0A0B2VUL8_TOXCA|nr:hypothetical protein Tcan_11084 [Toxocara canis]
MSLGMKGSSVKKVTFGPCYKSLSVISMVNEWTCYHVFWNAALKASKFKVFKSTAREEDFLEILVNCMEISGNYFVCFEFCMIIRYLWHYGICCFISLFL